MKVSETIITRTSPDIMVRVEFFGKKPTRGDIRKLREFLDLTEAAYPVWVNGSDTVVRIALGDSQG